MRKKETVAARLRRILDQVHHAIGLDDNAECEAEMEQILAKMADLPRENLLDALDQAVGRSTARKRASVYVLAELADVPEIKERLQKSLADPDPEWRRTVVDCISDRGWVDLAPLLNYVMTSDPDWLCRSWAIAAAGRLKQPVNLQVILELAQTTHPDREPSLVYAMTSYATEECRKPLWAAFHRTRNKGNKVVAAWGLAKLRERQAIEYLGKMLYDLEKQSPVSFDPGESWRAAQAIADLFGLPYKQDKSCVEEIRSWWEVNKGRILQEQWH